MKKLTFLVIFLYSRLLFSSTIAGFVKDSTNHEPLYPVNIWIEGTAIGTITNEKGYFILSGLKLNEAILVFSFIGYKEKKIHVHFENKESKRLDIYLEPIPIRGETVISEAEKEYTDVDLKPGQIVLKGSRLQDVPTVAEPDIFRSLQMLPGVASLSDFSAGLYIRGGSPDQNLILLDQIDVYNPNHLFGFFSSFLPDAVKNVELLKGGFPARFGGRLSSVLNVQNKEGNRERFQMSGRISLISSSLTLEGPWKKGSWMLAGRRTYLDMVGDMIDMDIPYYFYDLQGKVNIDINPSNMLNFSFYLGDDKLDLSGGSTNIFLKWGNKTSSLNWTHIFDNNLFFNLILAGSRFKSDTQVRFDDVRFGIFNEINDLTLKSMLTYAPNMRHTIDLGLEQKFLQFTLNNLIVDRTYRNEYSSVYSALYAQDHIRLDSTSRIQIGLRMSFFSDGSYWRIAPRVSYKRNINSGVSITASYGRYYQFLNLVQHEGLGFADMWFPVDHTFPPGESDHFILGLEVRSIPGLRISIEPYFKKYENLAEFREIRKPDEPLENQTAAQNFYRGTGKAYGMDILVYNTWKKINGWFGYSYGWVKKKTDGYNFNREYFPTYDRRHSFTMIQNVRLNRKWTVNISAKLATGQPFTQPTARYAKLTPDGRLYYEPLEGEKNFFRLPAYKRVDAGISYYTRWFGKPIELYLQIINIFNFKNVWFRRFETNQNPAEIEDVNMLPRIPTAGFNFKW